MLPSYISIKNASSEELMQYMQRAIRFIKVQVKDLEANRISMSDLNKQIDKYYVKDIILLNAFSELREAGYNVDVLIESDDVVFQENIIKLNLLERYEEAKKKSDELVEDIAKNFYTYVEICALLSKNLILLYCFHKPCF